MNCFGLEKEGIVLSEIIFLRNRYHRFDRPDFTKNSELIKSIVVDLGGWPEVCTTDMKTIQYCVTSLLKNGYYPKEVTDEQLRIPDKRPEFIALGENTKKSVNSIGAVIKTAQGALK